MALSLDSYRDAVQLGTPFQFQSKLFTDADSAHSIAVYQSVLKKSLAYFMREYRKMNQAQRKAKRGRAGGHGHSHSHAGGGDHGHSHSHGGDDDDDSDDDHHHHHDDDDNNDDTSEYDHLPTGEQRRTLHALLTIRPPGPIEANAASQLDELLYYEQSQRELTHIDSIPNITTRYPALSAIDGEYGKLTVWKGDIVTLGVDCIVNAANSQLLGCFSPPHRCIDNIIHSACGPRLRADCYQIMRAQGREEADGHAKVTRAYFLPSRYVVHTVGPQLPESRSIENENERRDLARCYRAALNCVAQIDGVKSIAFNCISTGLFRFPADRAAQIAIDTVLSWMHDQSSNQPLSDGGKRRTRIERVVFNVFKDADETHYLKYFAGLAHAKYIDGDEKSITATGATSATPSSSSSSSSSASASISSSSIPASVLHANPTLNSALQLATQWVSDADVVLIAGAAGLSASAGLDYTSSSVFASLFPSMYRQGYRNMYQFIGYRDWTPALQWGYFLAHSDIARFHWPRTNIYQSLLAFSQCYADDDSFVLTTNADGMFGQNGFPLDRVLTTQGDYGMMQCLTPCRPDALWPTQAFIDAALPYIDPHTQLITNTSVIPKCRHCSGPVMYNVRGGDWFLERHLDTMRAKYTRWLQSSISSGKRVLILEIGVGFNTPSVIRWPMERLAEQHANVRLIRINNDRAEVPLHLQRKRAIGLALDATDAVRIITRPVLEKHKKTVADGVSGAEAVKMAAERWTKMKGPSSK